MTKDTIKFIIDSALTGRRDRAFLSRESLQNTRCGKEDERTFMNFLNKMERKFGRYAIHNLSTYIIGAYVIGYFLYFLAPGVLYNYLSLEPYYILRGQIWRLITWVLIPPESPGIFTIIMLMLYYSLGNSLEQAKAAEAAGADYLGSGAVFGTSTKKDAKPMDHALLQEICESVKIPVVAIGGIDGGNILLLKGRKMAGVAVVSGLFACEDIKKAAEDLREKADRICE